MKCNYCGGEVYIKHSSFIYGKNFKDCGLLQVCENYPKCNSYGSRSVASPELRKLRQECHRIFDKIWQSGEKKRKSAYRWLGKKMKKKPEDNHIALFREDECKKMLEILNNN